MSTINMKRTTFFRANDSIASDADDEVEEEDGMMGDVGRVYNDRRTVRSEMSVQFFPA
jgi:hypothetical protein